MSQFSPEMIDKMRKMNEGKTSPPPLKEIQPTTNLPDPRTKRYLIIGVLIFILIGLFFAYKKYPKAIKMFGVIVLIALAVKGSINYKKYGNLIGWH